MKMIYTAAAIAAALVMAGCVREINVETEEAPPAAETITLPVTEAEPDEETETSLSETEAASQKEPVSEQAAEIKKGFADFMEIFGGDADSGYLGKSMKEVMYKTADGYDVKKLTAANVRAAAERGSTGRTLFGFTVNGTEGIVPISTDGIIYYAVGVTSDDGEEFTAVFGNSETTSPEEAEKYVNTCSRVDYLAVCSATGGGRVLMPVAAGNPHDGVYAVLPNVRLLGYDTEETEPFVGMTRSYTIRINKSEYDPITKTLHLFYETENSFPEKIFFRCEEIYIGGKYIPDEYKNVYPMILYNRGAVSLKCPEPAKGDIVFFKGAVFSEETHDLICSAGIAAYDNSAG